MKKAAPFVAAAGFAGFQGIGKGIAISPSADQRPRSIVLPASYVVYKEEGQIFGQNGSTGQAEFSGVDAVSVIQSTVDSLTNGGLIFLRRGTYSMTDRISVTKGIHLMGEKSTILKVEGFSQSASNPFNMIEIVGENVTIENLVLDGNSARNVNFAGNLPGVGPLNPDIQSGITVCSGSYSKIVDCSFVNIWNAGVWLNARDSNVENVEVAGCRFESIGRAYDDPSSISPPQSANAIYVFRLSGTTSKVFIHNNLIKDTNGRGIYLHFDNDSIVSNNILVSSRRYDMETGGIVVDHNVRRLIISGNHVVGYSPGIMVVWSGSEDVIVEGNQCSNAINAAGWGSGILVSNSDSGSPVLRTVIVRSNICKGNAMAGIHISASEVIVQGNLCYNNNQDTAAPLEKRAGLLIEGVPSGEVGAITVAGNRCFDDQPTPTQHYGVAIAQGTGSVRDVSVFNNDLRGNGSGAIGLLDGNLLRIRDNAGYNPQGVAAITVGDSPFTYTNDDSVPEVIYILGGAVSDISKNNMTISTNTPAVLWLEPGESARVIHADPPKMLKDKR